jgi:hypothetical protein
MASDGYRFVGFSAILPPNGDEFLFTESSPLLGSTDLDAGQRS